ncbi:hypothetical protein FN846DRAFT_614641 [Sphaerosporella brunnea]|uniref:Uncharacterized protein n=1 Tax=Sphaerosporella brunnea TaxID=1250544 RepID=A0A5J5EBV8_9PEZI|nr:hypothetical protein FN846DRAFT_614641 [Sphaerosporella brunnea]
MVIRDASPVFIVCSSAEQQLVGVVAKIDAVRGKRSSESVDIRDASPVFIVYSSAEQQLVGVVAKIDAVRGKRSSESVDIRDASPVFIVYSSAEQQLVGVVAKIDAVRGKRSSESIDPVRGKRSSQNVDIGGTGTDRRQHHDDPLLAVQGRVINVRSLRTAAIVLYRHVKVRKVRTPFSSADGREGAIKPERFHTHYHDPAHVVGRTTALAEAHQLRSNGHLSSSALESPDALSRP